MKTYANGRGIAIIGDVPLFVAHHSADVWVNRSLFSLDASGRPQTVAGVPPDYFAAAGQLWGNPQYNWQRLKADGYRWWRDRLRRQLQLADRVRIDHFRGLAAYWEINAGAKTAAGGRWVKGPGADFLLACCREFGSDSFIAEDLGIITDDVDTLRWQFEMPGMQVLQFALSGEPMTDDRHTVVYSGTHDNDTTAGWLRKLRDSDPAVYRRVCRRLGSDDSTDERQLTERLLRFALDRRADMVILPLQDILGLGTEARMNIPGTASGNWGWRLANDQLSDDISRKLANWLASCGRLPPPR